MDHRIQQVLDGELRRDALTADEARHLERAEELIDGVLSALPARPLPDLSRSVLRSIAKPRHEHDNALGWLWRARPLSLQWRPAYALAAAAIVAIVFLARGSVPRTNPAQHVLIEFQLNAPNAQQVSLAGDFSGWKPAYKLTRNRAGAWTIVVPLQPGVHEYAFVVDGEQWVADPMAPAVSDGFGGMNSRVAVLTPENRSM